VFNDGRIIGDFRFRKSERIRSRQEINRVFKEGQAWSCRGLRLILMPNASELSRVVFITIKKYGNAVKRNRARRLLSECWRLEKPRIKKGFDIAVLIYQDSDTFKQRQSQLRYLLDRTSLIL